MLKYVLLAISFSFLYSCSSSKYFTGEIVFKEKIIPKTESLNVDSVRQSRPGDENRYLITPGYYKSSFFDEKGNITYSFTYHRETKFMYDFYPDKAYITYRDSRDTYRQEGYDRIVYADSVSIIQGQECFLVIEKDGETIIKYHFPKKLRIDYSTFTDHNTGGWNSLLKKSDGALPIRTITDTPDYIVISEAERITKRKVQKHEFDLPDSLGIYASLSVLDEYPRLIKPDPEQIQCVVQMLADSPKPFNGTQSEEVYVEFLLEKTGEIKHVRPADPTEYDLGERAVEIFNTCELRFDPGKINGDKVTSIAYFPLEFNI